MLNQIVLQGRLTRDPECKFTTTGKQVTSFSLAVQRNFKNSEGKYDADFVNCVAFDKTVEIIGNYFQKNSQIIVVGRLQIDAAEKDGERRYYTKVVVSNIQFVDKKDNGGFADMGTAQADAGGFGG